MATGRHWSYLQRCEVAWEGGELILWVANPLVSRCSPVALGTRLTRIPESSLQLWFWSFQLRHSPSRSQSGWYEVPAGRGRRADSHTATCHSSQGQAPPLSSSKGQCSSTKEHACWVRQTWISILGFGDFGDLENSLILEPQFPHLWNGKMRVTKKQSEISPWHRVVNDR